MPHGFTKEKKMEESRISINTGLRGIPVASTRISDVDGKAGKLIYRGYLIQDLARSATFEETVHLLLYEGLPDKGRLARLSEALSENRHLVPEMIAALKTRPASALPMDILQAAVSMLAHHDPDIGDTSREASLRMAIRLIAKLPTVVAAWQRIRNHQAPIDPDPGQTHAGNFLYMLTGTPPSEEVARFFDVALILHAEHSFNASTFAAREVASTRAHMYAAAAAAVGSLSGELHGGANARVMEMLQRIGTVDAVEAHVEKVLASGGRIMGLGHAVYQTDDPRAHILAPMSKSMGERTGDTRWYEISKRLENVGKAAFLEQKKREIYVNVDFYSASLYHAMGIPIDLFTPVFAISRIAGWTAHVIEEHFGDAAPKPVLYRPESEYIGDYCGPAECPFVPLHQR
jgi:citrate synthase